MKQEAHWARILFYLVNCFESPNTFSSEVHYAGLALREPHNEVDDDPIQYRARRHVEENFDVKEASGLVRENEERKVNFVPS